MKTQKLILAALMFCMSGGIANAQFIEPFGATNGFFIFRNENSSVSYTISVYIAYHSMQNGVGVCRIINEEYDIASGEEVIVRIPSLNTTSYTYPIVDANFTITTSSVLHTFGGNTPNGYLELPYDAPSGHYYYDYGGYPYGLFGINAPHLEFISTQIDDYTYDITLQDVIITGL